MSEIRLYFMQSSQSYGIIPVIFLEYNLENDTVTLCQTVDGQTSKISILMRENVQIFMDQIEEERAVNG